MNLNDPFTRAVVETLVVATVTLVMLFIVASYMQNVFGVVVACAVATAGFVVVAWRARELMKDYG